MVLYKSGVVSKLEKPRESGLDHVTSLNISPKLHFGPNKHLPDTEAPALYSTRRSLSFHPVYVGPSLSVQLSLYGGIRPFQPSLSAVGRHHKMQESVTSSAHHSTCSE